MTISMIAAAGENNTLGKDGKLLWHLPNDLKRFKRLTLGHPVIMGRKTFETLPHPLPGRTNIIITRQKGYQKEGCVVVDSIEKALEAARKIKGNNEICIVGGGQIYELALPLANKIELTRIHHKFEGGDAFFPEIKQEDWLLINEEHHPANDQNVYSFTYLTYIKK